MGNAHSEHDGVCEVEDLESGQRYLMYRLPVGAWPPPARIVYECSSCRGRCEASSWKGRCPSCSGRSDRPGPCSP